MIVAVSRGNTRRRSSSLHRNIALWLIHEIQFYSLPANKLSLGGRITNTLQYYF